MNRTHRPAVSVVVPTYGRPERLAACLDALARLEPPDGGLEVIVVDDGSPVLASKVAEPYMDQMDVRVIRQSNAGPAVARNAGAAQARGPLLAFTDDDCQPDRGWARALAAAAEAHPDHLLIGHTVNALRQNLYAEASQQLLTYVQSYFGPETNRPLLVASLNMALPTEAFLALGGFDTSFGLAAGEDRDFAARWHESRRPAVSVPVAVVHHSHSMGLRGFWKQHMHYGRGAIHFHTLRRQRGIEDTGPEPLRFYTDLVAYPLRQSLRPKAWSLVGLMVLSQVANMVGYAAGRSGR